MELHCQNRGVIDDDAKECLHGELRWVRQSVAEKIDHLSEYQVRRPMTATGTNLLGLIKHLTMTETVYFGAVFGRSAPWPHPLYDDPGYRNRDSLWVDETQSRADILDAYQRAWKHADATIDALQLDAAGFIPWWPRPAVTLFNVMVHVLTESNRHAGHADILREQLRQDRQFLDWEQSADWNRHRERIERAARQADTEFPRSAGAT